MVQPVTVASNLEYPIISVSVSPDAANHVAIVPFTVTITLTSQSGRTPTGTIEIYFGAENSIIFGTWPADAAIVTIAQLTNGVATFSSTFGPWTTGLGNFFFSAQYSGDSQFMQSGFLGTGQSLNASLPAPALFQSY